MSERCHCMHECQKRACQHKDFCDRIDELEAVLDRLGNEKFLIDLSKLNGDEQPAIVAALDWQARIEYARTRGAD